MLKKSFDSLDSSKLIGATTDDVTLLFAIKSAFDEAFANDDALLKKIIKVRRSNNLRFVVAAGAIYYIYSTLSKRLEKLEEPKEATE